MGTESEWEKGTGNKREGESGRKRERNKGCSPMGYAHCARFKDATPNKTSSQGMMGGCGGYGTQPIHTHNYANTHTHKHTHTKSLPAVHF